MSECLVYFITYNEFVLLLKKFKRTRKVPVGRNNENIQPLKFLFKETCRQNCPICLCFSLISHVIYHQHLLSALSVSAWSASAAPRHQIHCCLCSAAHHFFSPLIQSQCGGLLMLKHVLLFVRSRCAKTLMSVTAWTMEAVWRTPSVWTPLWVLTGFHINYTDCPPCGKSAADMVPYNDFKLHIMFLLSKYYLSHTVWPILVLVFFFNVL